MANLFERCAMALTHTKVLGVCIDWANKGVALIGGLLFLSEQRLSMSLYLGTQQDSHSGLMKARMSQVVQDMPRRSSSAKSYGPSSDMTGPGPRGFHMRASGSNCDGDINRQTRSIMAPAAHDEGESRCVC